MNKPIAPIEPKIGDFPSRDIKFDQDHPFVVAYRKYSKSLDKYNDDLELFNQTKMIEDIKRSSLKLCLKKYRISKQ